MKEVLNYWLQIIDNPYNSVHPIKDSLLDGFLHETFEIRIFFFN